MKISPGNKLVILNFLQDWLNWATSKESDNRYNNRYNNRCGLCHSIVTYTINILNFKHSKADAICDDFESMFTADGLSYEYPFGEESYNSKWHTSEQHKDPVRLNWVKNTIKRLQTELTEV